MEREEFTRMALFIALTKLGGTLRFTDEILQEVGKNKIAEAAFDKKTDIWTIQLVDRPAEFA